MKLLTLSASAAVLALLSAPVLAAPDCSPGADLVDPRCYGAVGDDRHDDWPGLQQAADIAIATHRPLYLAKTGAAYRVGAGLTIDYAAIADEGFHIISHGARIDGNAVASGPVLLVVCSGGTSSAPMGCFYFHQEGTLFIDAHTPGNAVRIGKNDMSDAHNSPVFDHLIVNNNGSGGAVWLNYVLNASAFIVADSAGSVGLHFEQVQFGTWRGAATAGSGAAIQIGAGYTFGNSLEALDLEASPECIVVAPGHAAVNTIIGGTMNCAMAISDPQQRLQVSGVGFGGAVQGGMSP
jgi:hypothetical protein